MTLPLNALALPAAKLAIGTAASAIGALKNALTPEQQKIQKTAKDFETMFLENMLSHVFPQEVGEGPVGENGMGGQVYRGMLVNEYARNLSKSGGVGIADQVYRQMLQMQEGAPAARSAHVR
jgi:Rod binding domain-containing protein